MTFGNFHSGKNTTTSGRNIDRSISNHALTARELSVFHSLREAYGNAAFDPRGGGVTPDERSIVQGELYDQGFAISKGRGFAMNKEPIGPAYVAPTQRKRAA